MAHRDPRLQCPLPGAIVAIWIVVMVPGAFCLAGLGILPSEAARGGGASLRNSEGERFMER